MLQLSAAHGMTLGAQPDVFRILWGAGWAHRCTCASSFGSRTGGSSHCAQAERNISPNRTRCVFFKKMAQHWIRSVRVRRVGSAGSFPVVYGVRCVRVRRVGPGHPHLCPPRWACTSSGPRPAAACVGAGLLAAGQDRRRQESRQAKPKK